MSMSMKSMLSNDLDKGSWKSCRRRDALRRSNPSYSHSQAKIRRLSEGWWSQAQEQFCVLGPRLHASFVFVLFAPFLLFSPIEEDEWNGSLFFFYGWKRQGKWSTFACFCLSLSLPRSWSIVSTGWYSIQVCICLAQETCIVHAPDTLMSQVI